MLFCIQNKQSVYKYRVLDTIRADYDSSWTPYSSRHFYTDIQQISTQQLGKSLKTKYDKILHYTVSWQPILKALH